MPTITDHMKRAAREYAEQANAKIADLDRQLADIEDKKLKINAERTAARGALQRAADFPAMRGDDYLCPLCWTDDNVISTLRPVPSDTRQDMFRCNKCYFETVF
jgi:hypothetical protein